MSERRCQKCQETAPEITDLSSCMGIHITVVDSKFSKIVHSKRNISVHRCQPHFDVSPAPLCLDPT